MPECMYSYHSRCLERSEKALDALEWKLQIVANMWVL